MLYKQFSSDFVIIHVQVSTHSLLEKWLKTLIFWLSNIRKINSTVDACTKKIKCENFDFSSNDDFLIGHTANFEKYVEMFLIFIKIMPVYIKIITKIKNWLFCIFELLEPIDFDLIGKQKNCALALFFHYTHLNNPHNLQFLESRWQVCSFQSFLWEMNPWLF